MDCRHPFNVTREELVHDSWPRLASVFSNFVSTQVGDLKAVFTMAVGATVQPGVEKMSGRRGKGHAGGVSTGRANGAIACGLTAQIVVNWIEEGG
jgi:hypothetical protein